MMKIGVTSDAYSNDTDPLGGVPKAIIHLLRSHGITPVAVPIGNVSETNALIEEVDGLIIKGGIDVNPKLYHQMALSTTDVPDDNRDAAEFTALRDSTSNGKPVLGICRGMQAINVYFGGSLYQDIYSQLPNGDELLNHTADWDKGYFPTHMINVDPNSYLAKSVGTRTKVNSRHHQAVAEVGNGLKVVARADDGVVESIEGKNGLIQGVQWHPENLWEHDPKQEQLFENFFAHAKNRVTE
ncbi:gamma-glutamyl-gamma-aminobutyrate hydrolase family protein (plasmid) [Nicoliella spurrieriana]|uniref:Gamma-glutamyl-gamma-aminobutyrate hydrolase family protein n=1 Tax=Nicoliella spurrieriana TaxID=2925830 RepID=A0A976X4W5_9LACO|nr:gamma-glutamyl-gamma-aminobutyrate hydrolase family protein [Nicoliella spurrieriana]UQS86190.1 gamma-glutamyl-gamma-aminobutyrate hydrolase family protein [Nicoliella spurrieriana]